MNKFWLMIGMLAAECVFAWRPLATLFKLALENPEYSHILLVLPIVIASLFFDQNRVSFTGPPHRVIGLTLALLSAGTWWVSLRTASNLGDANLTLQVSAFILAVWATICLIYGWSFFRAMLFPLLFLSLLIPLPPIAVAKLTTALQSGSTAAAYWLFKIFGVPVTRSGFVLSLPSMDVEVAKECSGIRSTVILFVAALVLGQWFLRSSWRKAVLALSVFPIGIARNGLRIFTLSILGSYVNEGWLEGNLHHRGGAVFFVIGLGLVALLIWLLRRQDKQPAKTDCRRPAPPAPTARYDPRRPSEGRSKSQ